MCYLCSIFSYYRNTYTATSTTCHTCTQHTRTGWQCFEAGNVFWSSRLGVAVPYLVPTKRVLFVVHFYKLLDPKHSCKRKEPHCIRVALVTWIVMVGVGSLRGSECTSAKHKIRFKVCSFSARSSGTHNRGAHMYVGRWCAEWCSTSYIHSLNRNTSQL